MFLYEYFQLTNWKYKNWKQVWFRTTLWLYEISLPFMAHLYDGLYERNWFHFQAVPKFRLIFQVLQLFTLYCCCLLSTTVILFQNGVIILNRSNNSVFLYLKIYWNRQVFDLIRASRIQWNSKLFVTRLLPQNFKFCFWKY